MNVVTKRLALGLVVLSALAGPALAGLSQTVDVEIELRLDVDVVAKTWTATLEVVDPLDLTLGLQAIQFDVEAGDGMAITSSTLELPSFQQTGAEGLFEKGFHVIASDGNQGQDIQASQPLSNIENPYDSNDTSVIVGIGELRTATLNGDDGFYEQPQNAFIQTPVIAATGTWDYTGASTGGWIRIQSDSALNTLLPDLLPVGTVAAPDDGDYSSSSASMVDNHQVYVYNTAAAVAYNITDNDDVILDGKLEVQDGIALAVAGEVDVTGDLVVNGVLDAQMLTIGGDVHIAEGAVVSADLMSLPNAVQVDGILYVYTDSGLGDSMLGDVTVGPNGALILTDRPVALPALLAVAAGADPYLVIPEPASMFLLGTGALALIRRRR